MLSTKASSFPKKGSLWADCFAPLFLTNMHKNTRRGNVIWKVFPLQRKYFLKTESILKRSPIIYWFVILFGSRFLTHYSLLEIHRQGENNIILLEHHVGRGEQHSASILARDITINATRFIEADLRIIHPVPAPCAVMESYSSLMPKEQHCCSTTSITSAKTATSITTCFPGQRKRAQYHPAISEHAAK